MKKFFLLLMIILTMSGCGSSGGDDKAVHKTGTLAQLNSTPEKATKYTGEDHLNFYDDFKAMQMALSAKQIDKMHVYGSVAKYLTKNNSEFAVGEEQAVKLVDNFCCAVRKDNSELRDAFNAAIEEMRADGTLAELVKQYIDNPTLNPPAVPLPTFENAKTIRVGITGDLPPLDLVLADGTPAGFNTAVLAEISRRIGQNIELVQISSAARAVALTSGEVDVIFWVVVPEGDSNRPKDFDTPEGIAVTDPYYQDTVVSVNLSNIGAGF